MQDLHPTSTHNKPAKEYGAIASVPLRDIPMNTKDLNMFLSHRIVLAKTKPDVTIAYITCNVLRGPYGSSKAHHGPRGAALFHIISAMFMV